MSECINCDYYDSCSLPEPNEKCYSTEDYVKVVRCKDCEYGITIPNYEKQVLCCAMTNPNYRKPDDFCSRAERKETE